VRAGDVAEQVRGGQDRQAEAEADQQLLRRVVGAAGREDRAEAEEEQHERADELGERRAEDVPSFSDLHPGGCSAAALLVPHSHCPGFRSAHAARRYPATDDQQPLRFA
jgi:hypothetical protein